MGWIVLKKLSCCGARAKVRSYPVESRFYGLRDIQKDVFLQLIDLQPACHLFVTFIIDSIDIRVIDGLERSGC